jgi:hypothetical protein
VTELTKEQAKALHAEPAQLLGYYPANLDPESVVRYRQQGAPSQERRPDYDRHKWRHFAEAKRQRDVDERDRAELADFYD